ncbi:MAG TPA: hypothetical protein VNA89_02830 [Gemmatimonadaceae bacterium]|nr:hypothetical protein [Gemmatimonadaceae bacterium]
MRRYVFAAAAMMLAACPGPRSGSQATGAKTPRQAVETFLSSVRAQDLQAMAAVWGSKKGPARDNIPATDLEKRELIMMCYIGHDRFRIVRDQPGQEGRRVFTVELRKADLTRVTSFYAIAGPSDRWYVETADLGPLQDFCKGGPPTQR